MGVECNPRTPASRTKARSPAELGSLPASSTIVGPCGPAPWSPPPARSRRQAGDQRPRIPAVPDHPQPPVGAIRHLHETLFGVQQGQSCVQHPLQHRFDVRAQPPAHGWRRKRRVAPSAPRRRPSQEGLVRVRRAPRRPPSTVRSAARPPRPPAHSPVRHRQADFEAGSPFGQGSARRWCRARRERFRARRRGPVPARRSGAWATRARTARRCGRRPFRRRPGRGRSPAAPPPVLDRQAHRHGLPRAVLDGVRQAGSSRPARCAAGPTCRSLSSRCALSSTSSHPARVAVPFMPSRTRRTDSPRSKRSGFSVRRPVAMRATSSKVSMSPDSRSALRGGPIQLPGKPLFRFPPLHPLAHRIELDLQRGQRGLQLVGRDRQELVPDPQRLFGADALQPLVVQATALGQVADHLGEPQQRARLVVDRRDDDVRPEPRAVLADPPALFLEPAGSRGGLQLHLATPGGGSSGGRNTEKCWPMISLDG